jgi:hypothetical protein
VSADQLASRKMADFVSDSIKQKAYNSKEHKSTEFNILTLNAIAIGVVVSLFDWRSRSFDVRGAGDYPHPLVRWSIIIQAISESLGWTTNLATSWLKNSTIGVRFVNAMIGSAFMCEYHRDRERGLSVPAKDMLAPIAQLTFDENPIGQSVLFDHIIRSVERGRRLELLISQFETARFPLVAMYGGSPDDRWRQQLERLHELERRRRKGLAPVAGAGKFGPA